MRMYAISVAEEVSKEKLPKLMLDLIEQLNLKEVKVICKEIFDYPWTYDLIVLPHDRQVLLKGLELLAKDLLFFTLSCKERALIIPFEGSQFNIIVPNQTRIPTRADLCCEDVTLVLEQYPDAYEGFGLAQTFTRAESVMH